MDVKPGKLFVVPTPVGNLDDITFRALKTLQQVDLILAEDTRTSSVLLKHFDIHKEMMSHHKFNEHQTTLKVVEKIRTGANLALISDAGTPAISDPGFMLVRECAKQGIEVVTLPGPTAFVPAVVTSALPNDRFCFEGFLPQKKGRNTRMKELVEEKRTMIFYESPYRVRKTLELFALTFGENRQAATCREISKIHEQCVRGTLKELLSYYEDVEPKGEFVIVAAGANDKSDENKESNMPKNKYKNLVSQKD